MEKTKEVGDDAKESQPGLMMAAPRCGLGHSGVNALVPEAPANVMEGTLPRELSIKSPKL
jgi:hypothetical protein